MEQMDVTIVTETRKKIKKQAYFLASLSSSLSTEELGDLIFSGQEGSEQLDLSVPLLPEAGERVKSEFTLQRAAKTILP